MLFFWWCCVDVSPFVLFFFVYLFCTMWCVQYRTKHQPTGVWVDCGDGIYPTMAHMVLECAPLVGHFFRVRAHNDMGWSDWSQASEGLVTLRRH